MYTSEMRYSMFILSILKNDWYDSREPFFLMNDEKKGDMNNIIHGYEHLIDNNFLIAVRE